MDTAFLTRVTGERTNSGGWVRERPQLLQSEARYKGSHTKAARSTLHKPRSGPELHYIGVHSVEGKVKKQSQDKTPRPKGDKEGVTIHSPNNTRSF